MSKDTGDTKIELVITAKFRATVFNLTTPCGNPAFTSAWCDTYEEATAAMNNFLVDVGIGYAGEVEKVYMTSRTWDNVLNVTDDE